MRSKRASTAVDHAAHALSRTGDDQLLALAAAGNSRAFEAIVERYRPALTRFCESLTQAERVDDAVQQTFVSAWLAIDRGVLVRDLRPWLYRIARNAAIDQHRARGLGDGQLPDELVGGNDPASLAAGRSYLEDVLRAVSDLPERQRVALLETAVHGRSTDSVASDLGVSGGALRQLVHRARVTVRTTVTSLGAGPLTGWLSQLGSDDSGLRRVATVLGGTGSGAVAALSKSTAAVVSAGAIAAGGIVSTAEHHAAGKPTRATASTAGASRVAGSGGSTSGGSPGADAQAGHAARADATGTAGAMASPSAGTLDTVANHGTTGGGAQAVTVALPTSSRPAANARSKTASHRTPADLRSANRSRDETTDDGAATSGATSSHGTDRDPAAVATAPAAPVVSHNAPAVQRPVQSSITAARAPAPAQDCNHGAAAQRDQPTSTAASTSAPTASSTSSAAATPSSAPAPAAPAASTTSSPTSASSSTVTDTSATSGASTETTGSTATPSAS